MRGLAAAAVLLAACVTTAPASPTLVPSSPVATAVPTPAPAASPPAATYVGATYRITLPLPWRRATCVGFSIFGGSPGATPPPVAFADTFVPVREEDEVQGDVGIPLDVIFVRAERTGATTPRAYVDRGSLGPPRDLRVADVTLDGRPAVLVRSGIVAGAPAGIADVTYVVAEGAITYLIGYRVQTRSTDAAAAEQALATFHILPDAERTTPSTSPAPSARSLQAIAQGLADAFAASDADALAAFMAPCMAQFFEQAGGTNRPRSGLVAQLRSDFARGLSVTVQATPGSDRLGTFVPATWTMPGQPAQRRDLYLRDDGGGRWTWFLVLVRQPSR